MVLADLMLAHNGKHRKKSEPAGKKKKKKTFLPPDRLGRKVVQIGPVEYEVNDSVAEALSRDESLYQRAGNLARVVVSDASPRIEPLDAAILRETITRVTCLRQMRGENEIEVHPPSWCVQAVHNRKQWPVPELEAVVEYPVLTPAGKVIAASGYDPSTRLYFAPMGKVAAVPSNPKAEHVHAAKDLLLDLISDFPWVDESHRSSWFAAALTPLARFAFDGPAPLFLADANVQGVGKTTAIKIIGSIITGRHMSPTPYTSDSDEMRKRITSAAMAGCQLIMLDNLEGYIKSAPLDVVLTSNWWSDRLLGVNKNFDGRIRATWFGTGNNCQLSPDLASRRTCWLRMESPLERPDTRSDFKHDIEHYALQERPRLLAALLTLLQAYSAAGKPDQHLKAWGSYTAWSHIVRNCIAWAGLADPYDSRPTVTGNDPQTEALGLLMLAWKEVQTPRGLTSGEFVRLLDEHRNKSDVPEWVSNAQAALDVLVGKLDSRAIGTLIRTRRKRVVNNLYFDAASQSHNANRWLVRTSAEFSGGGRDTPPAPPTPTDGECGESGECDSQPAPAQKNTGGYVANMDEEELQRIESW